MILKGIENISSRIVSALEDNQIPFINYILTFLFILFIRVFLEFFSLSAYDAPSPNFLLSTLHVMQSYLNIFLLLGIAFSLVLKINLEKIFRVMLPLSILIFICPITDLTVSLGQGIQTSYIGSYATLSNSILKTYLTYFGGFQGASIGIRIEVAFIVLVCGVYAFMKGLSILKSILFAWLAYTIIFLWACSPYVVELSAHLFHFIFIFNYFSFTMLNYFMLFNLPLCAAAFYMIDPVAFRAVAADFRFLRILFYVSMAILGVSIALFVQPNEVIFHIKSHPVIVVNAVLLTISVVFACLYSLMINNLNDVDIDSISNPSRPLVKGVISRAQYAAIAYVFFGLAFFYALLVNAKTFLCIGTFMGAYYIYSAQPFRFKRVPVLSKLTIGFNAFVCIVLGFLSTNDISAGFPREMFWICIIGFTLSANFIDLKDIAGDKAGGIMTLPILIGDKYAKRLIGLAFFFTSLSFYFLLSRPILLPIFAGTGLLYYYLINRKHYSDKMVVLLTDVSIIALSCYIFLEKMIRG